MKLHLIIPTAAVVFSALSGSVSATSLRGGVAITSDLDDLDSADYYPEGEDYDHAPVDYYSPEPEPEDDYDYVNEDEQEDYPDDVASFGWNNSNNNNRVNKARAQQQLRRFGTSARAGSNRESNTRGYLRDNGFRTERTSNRGFRITGNTSAGNRQFGRITSREAARITNDINRNASRNGYRNFGRNSLSDGDCCRRNNSSGRCTGWYNSRRDSCED